MARHFFPKLLASGGDFARWRGVLHSDRQEARRRHSIFVPRCIRSLVVITAVVMVMTAAGCSRRWRIGSQPGCRWGRLMTSLSGGQAETLRNQLDGPNGIKDQDAAGAIG